MTPHLVQGAGSSSASAWFAAGEIATIFGTLYAAPNIGHFPIEVTLRDGDGRVIRKIDVFPSRK